MRSLSFLFPFSIILIIAAIILCGAHPANAVIYVKFDATGANNGASWIDAFTDLQDALAAAALSSGDIWVAAGTYAPTGGVDRTISFQLLNGVAIYGGFDGSELTLAGRDLSSNTTVLSGDIGTPADSLDNSYHVVTGGGTDSTAVLDGFTVMNGNASGVATEELMGGGIFNDTGSPTVRNVYVIHNTATWGGGMSNRNGSHGLLVNAVFSGNTATFGGGLYNILSNPTVTNICIVSNTAATSGGGLTNANHSDPLVYNSIIWGNTAPDAPQVYNTFLCEPVFINSNIQDAFDTGVWDTDLGVDGGNNVDGDPVFADEGNGDYHLTLHSPLLNTGNNSALGLPAEDLDGEPRIFGGTVDVGAYELSVVCPPGPVVYVDKDALGAGDGTSWIDAYLEARDAFVMTSMCSSIEEIWIAEGNYTPSPVVNRGTSFVLQNGLEVYGGFVGGEVNREDREPRTNTTTLNGWVDTQNNAAYHVVVARDVDSTTILDGVTVTFGNGGYLPTGDYGKGGGILIINGSPRINDVRFEQNTSTAGGGVYIDGGSPKFTDVWFYYNRLYAEGDRLGAGVYNNGGDPVFVNAVFFAHHATKGGAIYSASGSPVITNSTLSGNTATEGPALYVETGSPVTTNSIFWTVNTVVDYQVAKAPGATPVFSNSDIEGSGGSGVGWNPQYGIDGGNNLDVNPMFDDEWYGVWLQAGSPAINAGDNSAPHIPAMDYAGNPRVVDSIVDIGAFEFQYVCPPRTMHYVDKSATGANDGSSWIDAFTELSDAIDLACADIEEIWVAAGTYKPTDGTDRGASLRIRSGLALYGGFAGGEGSIAERDIVANPTVLSGDIGVEDVPTDNSYHIVSIEDTDDTSVLDGFIVRNGHASSPEYSGSGLWCWESSPTVRNVTFDDNHAQGGGGGVQVYEGAPVFVNVTFSNNSAYDGGGISLTKSDAILRDVVFTGNTAHDGGAIRIFLCAPEITNALFHDNSGAVGGTIYHNTSNPVYTNVTITQSSASLYGGVMFSIDNNQVSGSHPVFVNTIMWGSSGPGGELIWNSTHSIPTYSHSIVQGSLGSGPSWNTDFGADLGYNLDVDPEFAGPGGNNFRLLATSPGIDAGDSAAPNLPATDLDGNPRVVGADVDMGTYEYGSGTGIGDDTPSVTHRLEFRSVYPNPFNPTLTVAFELDRRREVRVVVYDVQGKFVDELFKGVRNAGPHRLTWDAVDRSGAPAASGVYFIEVQSGAWRDSRKVILLK